MSLISELEEIIDLELNLRNRSFDDNMIMLESYEKYIDQEIARLERSEHLEQDECLECGFIFSKNSFGMCVYCLNKT